MQTANQLQVRGDKNAIFIRSLVLALSLSTQSLLAVVMLGSGGAFVGAIFFGAPLGFTLLLLGATAIALVTFRWSRLAMPGRLRLRRQLCVGLAAGLAATAMYDLSRLLLVHFGQLPVSPFATFPLFGQLIVGTTANWYVVLIVGTTYHVLNGVCFATAYCLWLGGRDWRLGVFWALTLEAATLMIYPGWLDLDAVLSEFVAMSVIGHLVYGTVLGMVSQHWLTSQAVRNSQAEASGTHEPRRVENEQ